MSMCANCGAENQPGALFCEMCGTRLAAAAAPAAPAAPSVSAAAGSATGAGAGSQTCPTCGEPVIPGEAFCDNCGSALSPAAAPVSGPAVGLPAPPAQPAPQPSYPPPQPLAAAGTSCPACGAAVIPGEAYCDTCGAAQTAQAAASVAVPPALPDPPPAPRPAASAPAPQLPVPGPAAIPAPGSGSAASLQGMALDIAGSLLSLPASSDVVIGRHDPASGHFPDVDLAPFGAFEAGVGRRHARLLVRGGQVLLEDLDSTNGTLINRQRVPPRQPTALQHGDEIRIGKLVMTFRAHGQ